ncbi:MAG: hypothetical protein R2815_12215 [Flavobacteriales bacterium]
MVGLEADVVDEAALFRAEQVARATDVEVLHGDVDAAAEVAELLDGLQALAREVGQQVRAGREQVAVGLPVAAPHAAAQLVQVAEAEVLRLVHDDRVRVRDVEAVLHDGGADEHIGVALDEVEHHLLELVAFELTVAHAHARRAPACGSCRR